MGEAKNSFICLIKNSYFNPLKKTNDVILGRFGHRGGKEENGARKEAEEKSERLGGRLRGGEGQGQEEAQDGGEEEGGKEEEEEGGKRLGFRLGGGEQEEKEEEKEQGRSGGWSRVG